MRKDARRAINDQELGLVAATSGSLCNKVPGQVIVKSMGSDWHWWVCHFGEPLLKCEAGFSALLIMGFSDWPSLSIRGKMMLSKITCVKCRRPIPT